MSTDCGFTDSGFENREKDITKGYIYFGLGRPTNSKICLILSSLH